MQHINYRLLNGGWYALLIDGEEIGTVYKQEHARMIETATIEHDKLEAAVNNLSEELNELKLDNRIENGRKTD